MTKYMNYEQRFMQKINKTDTCWMWVGALSSRGYGSFRFNGKSISSHRFSYLHFNGEIPDGMIICHKCDTPACVNPEHLFVGSYADNNKDMFEKDRNGQSSRPQTRCRRGHEFAVVGVKTAIKKGKANRTCHECVKIRDKSRLTDPVEREKRRNYQREYQREYRNKTKVKGL